VGSCSHYQEIHIIVGAMKTTNFRNKFGRRLRQLRTNRGLTQQELSELVECSTEYISRTERGLSSPSFDILERLAKALMVDAKDLFDFVPHSRIANGEK
jgi:transcriptional regulator with XRE-family HTH domain